MPTRPYHLIYDGYWLYPDGLPNEPGIYSVYACEKSGGNTVSIRKLIYIGESEDAKYRLENHERLEDWGKYLEAGEVFCFNFAPIRDKDDRKRVEEALIYAHQPPGNVEHVDYYSLRSPTTVRTSGANARLKKSFTVRSNG